VNKILIFIILLLSSLFAETKKVLIISTPMAAVSQKSKMHYIKSVAENYSDLKIDYTFLDKLAWRERNGTIEFSEAKELNTLEKVALFKKYDMVIFDSVAGAMSLRAALNKLSDALNAVKDQTIIEPINIEKESGYRKNITIEDHKNLYLYWTNGGEKNLNNMVLYIKNHIFKQGEKKVSKPLLIPKKGVYHPKYENIVFDSTQAYFDHFNIKVEDKPIIAFAFHRGEISANTLGVVDYAIEKIEALGAIALPYYTEVAGEDFVGLEFLQEQNRTIVDVVINYQLMFVNHEYLKEQYKLLNRPIFHALKYRKGDSQDWLNDTSGVEFSMIPMSYIIPETMGFTDSMIVAAQEKTTKETKVIPYQMEALVRKAYYTAILRHMPNRDKKVAIMFYNYPPGVDNMGAAFMNIPRSLEQLFKAFAKEGYATQERNSTWFEEVTSKMLQAYYCDVNIEQMLADGVADLYPFEDYMKFFNALPDVLKHKMLAKWGYPHQDGMIVTKDKKLYFLIPRVKIGNIVVMPQPRRANKNQGDKRKNSDANLWHNSSIAINHSYLASYLYVRRQLDADALIHFGTHGTQEWMPGKERGLSIVDSPYLAVGNIPIFYPYITNNVAEAIQVKRRGRGTLISHQTPPFGLTGTYNELSELMELITQYKRTDADILKDNLQTIITQKAMTINLHKDIEFTSELIAEDFERFLSRLEDYIMGTSAIAQPLGMHTFGTYPKDEHLITTVMQMLGKGFMEKADGKEYSNRDYQEFNSSKSYQLLKKYIVDGEDISTVEPEFKPYIKQALAYADAFRGQKEIANLLRALNGEFIAGGVGGDPIRNPSCLPTGNNLYGFDPSKVPTPASYQTGQKMMEEFIANYYDKHGKYPTKLTFNLWSLETMRHYGVLESQILYAMGVKPIWNENGLTDEYLQSMAMPMLKNYLPDFLAEWIASLLTQPRIEMVLGWLPEKMSKKPLKMLAHAKATRKGDIVDVEIIPYSELKRPRVDVVISATGLYRDTFPQTMQLLAKAVDKVAELKEEHNYVRINSENLKLQLLEQNLSIKDATRLSTIRIFSNKTGKYGSGVNRLEDTEGFTANIDTSIAKEYLEERGYYFGADEEQWNQKLDRVNLYAQNLSGTEGIIFSRTSNLYALLTSDDPYGYFGSIAMAIRHIDGKAPKSYIANLRDPNGAKMQTTAEFMSQELRSRYLHPKWIAKMQAEGQSGTQAVLDVVNNFWGWQVVDPSVVRDDQWQELFEVYVEDKYELGLKEWFESNSADNLLQIMARMLEAVRLGYWEVDKERLKKLKERFQELQKQFKLQNNNSKLQEFVKNKEALGGYGLTKTAISSLVPPNETKNTTKEVKTKADTQQIKGAKLEEVQVYKSKDNQQWIFYLILLGVVLIGMLYQWRQERKQ